MNSLSYTDILLSRGIELINGDRVCPTCGLTCHYVNKGITCSDPMLRHPELAPALGHALDLGSLEDDKRYVIYEYQTANRKHPIWVGISASRKGSRFGRADIPEMLGSKVRAGIPCYVFPEGIDPNQI